MKHIFSFALVALFAFSSGSAFAQTPDSFIFSMHELQEGITEVDGNLHVVFELKDADEAELEKFNAVLGQQQEILSVEANAAGKSKMVMVKMRHLSMLKYLEAAGITHIELDHQTYTIAEYRDAWMAKQKK